MPDHVGVRQQARTPAGSGGWPAALVATLVVAMTVLGSAIVGLGSLAEGQFPIVLVALELGGAALLVGAAWATSAHRPHASLGLAITAVSLALPVWAGWPSLADPFRASVLAVEPLAVAGTAQVALQWSTVSGQSQALRTVFSLGAAATLVQLLAFNPALEPGCGRACIDVEPLASEILDTRLAVAVSGALTIAGAVVAVVALVVAGAAVARPIATAAVVAMILLSMVPVLRVTRWSDPQSFESVLMLPYCAGLLLSCAVAMEVGRAWRTRAAVVHLVARLSDRSSTPDDFDGMIDEVQFAVQGEDRWVDAMGRPVPEPPGDRHSVFVSDRSGPVARLLVSPSRDPGEVLGALTPVARLSLGNAQLIAATKAHVADIQASRKRIVATADAENRRIERDLHDGAQQRLVSAALYLGVARGRSPRSPMLTAQLTAAEESVREALAHLRRLAHGVFPGILTQAGLQSTLDEIARTALQPVTLEVDGDIDVDENAAVAAYALVATALEQGTRGKDARGVNISVRRTPGVLELEVELPDLDPLAAEFTDAGDRIGALGGTLTMSATPSGVMVKAGVPCAL